MRCGRVLFARMCRLAAGCRQRRCRRCLITHLSPDLWTESSASRVFSLSRNATHRPWAFAAEKHSAAGRRTNAPYWPAASLAMARRWPFANMKALRCFLNKALAPALTTKASSPGPPGPDKDLTRCDNCAVRCYPASDSSCEAVVRSALVVRASGVMRSNALRA
ncbi:hypothetical protein PSPO01_05528 [Paraphaeosphaeria sporulosa]